MPAVPRSLARRLSPKRLRRTLGAASCVRERARFVMAELRDRHAQRQYRLRGTDLVATIRHPLLDMWVLEEVFRHRAYELPAGAARALDALGRPPAVADLGGHVGLFGLWVLSLYPRAVIESFEPDPRNARVLRDTIEANRRGDSWALTEACAAASDGRVEFDSSFHLSGIARGSALDDKRRGVATAFPFMASADLLRSERRAVAARDAFPLLSRADLVKIDIEGGEWEILADPRFASLPARAIVLEYHPPYGPHDDAEAAVRGYLAAAGLECGPASYGDDAATLWAWRTS